MASRRKSAKPTNKLRLMEIENEDFDDIDDNNVDNDEDEVQIACASLSTLIETKINQATKSLKRHTTFPTIHVNNATHLQSQQTVHNNSTPSLLTQHVTENERAMTPCEAMEEPLLALPSDVYNDFEALKSASKLDSPALMRKLIKYYNKLTSSTVVREKKLDDVIESIRGRSSSSAIKELQASTTLDTNSAVVLDLSVNKKSSEQQSHPHTSSNDIITDDIFDNSDHESSPRPLDLTLQKQKTVTSFSQDTDSGERPKGQNDIASSLFSTSFQTPVASPCVYSSTDINQAAPYVINLEPLTSTTIQLSTSIQNLNKTEQKSKSTPPTTYDSNLITSIGQRSVDPRSLLQHLSSKLPSSTGLTNVQNTTSPAAPMITKHLQQTVPKLTSYPPSALFPMPNTSLPSYKEAITSCFLSKQIENRSNLDRSGSNSDTLSNKVLDLKNANIHLNNHLINSDGRHISVLHLGPEFQNTKGTQPQVSASTPDNFLLEPSHFKCSPSTDITSTPNFLLSDSVPIPSARPSLLSSSSNQQSIQFEVPTGLSTNRSHHKHQISIPIPSATTQSVSQSPPTIIASTESETHIPQTTISASHTVLSQPSTMPLQSFFVSQTSDGAVSNLVAIPVLQGLPEGYTALQQFTFEQPFPIPVTSCSTQKATTPTPEEKSVKHTIVSTPNFISQVTTNNNLVSQTECPTIITDPITPSRAISSNVDNTTNYYSHQTQTEPNKEWAKMKPGRPKGRTGKVHVSRKNQNKGMKLLTENSLFPGVYTSILKLPWSRRTRNKSKAKTDTSIKLNHDDVIDSNSTYRVNNKSDENSFISESSYVPPELMVSLKDPENNMVIVQPEESKDETMLQIHRHQIELEQQQQFQNEYQLQLNREQQKATKGLVDDNVTCHQIPCTSTPSSTSEVNGIFTDNLQPVMNIKQEIFDTTEIQSEIRQNVMLSSASIAATGQDQYNNIPNSQDPIMLIYPNIGPNGSKSKKRRGRPPKKPMVDPKVHQDSFLFPVESIFHSPDSISDASFLNGNNSNITFIPNVNTSLNQELALLSPTSSITLPPPPQPPLDKTTTTTLNRSTGSSDIQAGLQDPCNEETSLENKIIYLTSQIELEMARGSSQQLNQQSQPQKPVEKQTYRKISPEPSIEKHFEPSSQIAQPEEKHIQGVKRRRKKTSRLLKSNENFVYATFRFKPRGSGSGAKKSKKKRKVNTTTLTANAETIANLRNKKLKCSESATHNSDTDTARTDSFVQSWKFHEQYPSETYPPKGHVPILSITSCSACRAPVRKIENMPSNLHLCHSCSRNNIDNKEDSGDGSPQHDNELYNERDLDILQASCISCGKKFERLSDSDMQCESCRRNIQSFIGSSKLFSIPETTNKPTCSSTTLPITPTPHYNQTSENEEQTLSSDPNTPMTADGILFCSLCRMQFTKISEYLIHLKETHDSTHSFETIPSSHRSVFVESSKTIADLNQRKVKSSLKTKKSLAHKTITCPVEDCPLFFRHQRDMDHHLKKVHQSSNLSRETCISPQQNDNPITQRQISNLNEISQNPYTSLNDTMSQASNNSMRGPAVSVTLEENGNVQTSDQILEKPLRCSFCNFRCRQKNAMLWHMRKHPEAASQHRCYSNVSSE